MHAAARDQRQTRGRGPEPDGPPEARPGPPFADLLGRQPVRLVVEGNNLVAYGFGRQRIAFAATSVSEVVLNRGPSLVLLDQDQHMLLRAAGNWGCYGLGAVCARAGLPQPSRAGGYGRASRRGSTQAPSWPRARGYRRLRVRPRGFVLAMLLVSLAAVALACLGAVAGALPAVALPGSTGSVRTLIGIAGGAAGAAAGLWLFTRCVRTGLAAVRWSAASLAMRSPAPWAPFYPRGGRRERGKKLLTAAMVLAVPALVGWGPGVGIATLVHGFHDQATVSRLRAAGVPVPGYVIGIPHYSTDSDGNPEVTYQANLAFTAGTQRVLTPDPAIGGRHWPIGPEVVTVVYDPAQPVSAAVAGQLRGSPWGGAPLGNLISGALLTLALPVLTWRVARRVTRRRRATRDGLLEGIW